MGDVAFEEDIKIDIETDQPAVMGAMEVPTEVRKQGRVANIETIKKQIIDNQ